MEKHGEEYYLEQATINRGMGIEYDIEFHKLQDACNHREIMDRYAHLKKVEEIQQNSNFIFVTVNPNPQITLLDFINKMNKLMSKKWITNYLYVFEQRGENLAEIGKGFHFHLILQKPKTKAYTHIYRELGNSANSVCDSSNFNFFNCKAISNEEKERKIIYLTGRKADSSKWLKQDMDIIFRQKNNLQIHYNVGIL